MRYLMLFAFILIMGCGQQAQQQNQPDNQQQAGLDAVDGIPDGNGNPAAKEDPVEVPETTTLYREYMENAIKADLKYTDKLVQISTTFWDAQKVGNKFLVRMVTASGMSSVSADLYCWFSPEEAAKLADLKRWQRILIRGVCRGKSPQAGTWKGWKVTIEDCQFVQVLKDD